MNQSTGKESEVGPNSVLLTHQNDIRNVFMSFGGGTRWHFSKNFELTLIINKLSKETERTLHKFHNTL